MRAASFPDSSSATTTAPVDLRYRTGFLLRAQLSKRNPDIHLKARVRPRPPEGGEIVIEVQLIWATQHRGKFWGVPRDRGQHRARVEFAECRGQLHGGAGQPGPWLVRREGSRRGKVPSAIQNLVGEHELRTSPKLCIYPRLPGNTDFTGLFVFSYSLTRVEPRSRRPTLTLRPVLLLAFANGRPRSHLSKAIDRVHGPHNGPQAGDIRRDREILHPLPLVQERHVPFLDGLDFRTRDLVRYAGTGPVVRLSVANVDLTSPIPRLDDHREEGPGIPHSSVVLQLTIPSPGIRDERTLSPESIEERCTFSLRHLTERPEFFRIGDQRDVLVQDLQIRRNALDVLPEAAQALLGLSAPAVPIGSDRHHPALVRMRL